jgi:hypothetical protein
MSDSSNTPPSDETTEVTPSPKERTENLTIKWIEVISKALIAAAGVGITVLGYYYQNNATKTELLLQQEKGDIEIRAQMFSKITDHIMGENNSAASSPIEQSLLTQMLALNFHELIELKPLMLNLDRELTKCENTDPECGQAKDELKSVSRRIRDRQLSTLIVQSEVKNRKDYNDSRVVYFSAIQNKKLGSKDSCSIPELQDSNLPSRNICFGSPLIIDDFHENKSVQITVNEADWKNAAFEVSFISNLDRFVPPEIPPNQTRKKVETCIPKEDTNVGSIPNTKPGLNKFNITQYDLPFTDNTLKPDGRRYSVFIDKVCRGQNSTGGSVRLGVLFFPKDYYPSRDRPSSYSDLNPF